MRFATVFTLGAAVVSTSASLLARQSVPNCAAPCIANANLGGCLQADTHCLCTNTTFVSTTTQCIEAACTGSDLQSAIAYAQALCIAVGVTLTSSSTATPASTSASTSASTTPTSPSTSSSTSSSSSPAATASKAAAAAHGANAFAGLAAVGLVALAL